MSYLQRGTTGRTLEAFVDLPGGAEMTIDGCTSACQSEGYIYAGVEFGDECCEFSRIDLTA